MLHYFQPLIDYLRQHPEVGAVLAFFIALAESLPIIGTIIPGSITMTAIGTLVGTGLMPGISTLAWASFGALVGDTIGFGMGYLFNDTIRSTWPFKKYPHWLELSEKFFEKHGGKSIIIGRFVGPARSTVPLVAGLLKMTWGRFILAAIPSAIMWAVLYMVPGILIGALAIELPPHIATEFLLVGLIVIVSLWLIFWAIQYFFSQLAHSINVMVDKLWDILIQHKPSRPLIRLIAVKGNPSDHYQLTLSLLFLLFAILFLLLFYSVINASWVTNVNQTFFYLIQSLRTIHFDHFFILITLLGKSTVMLSAGIIISIGLALVRQWRAALHILAADILMAGAVHFFKMIYHNPRPAGFQIVDPSSSFPSGHTGISFIILTALAYFTAKLIKPGLKWLSYLIAVIMILLIAISRLYLGAHWLTDILGSFFLGLSVLFFVIINYRRSDKKQFQRINKVYWAIVILLSIFIPWTTWTYKNYQHAVYRYKPIWPTATMTTQQWWKQPTKHLPIYRLNRFGKPIQPFNLQWLGSLPEIQSQLNKQGWATIDPKYSVKGTLKRFANREKTYHLPLLPWLYHHQPPNLILMKTISDGKIIELRLWDSEAKITNSKMQLWLGTVNFHLEPSKRITFSNFKQVSLQQNAGINRLRRSLQKTKKYQFQQIVIHKNEQPKKVQALNWSGRILVIRRNP